jgi:hypothetical protein
MSTVHLRAHAARGGKVGGGAPATAEDLAAVGGPLLVHASRWSPDVVLRAGLVWPILQHAAFTWRLSDGAADPVMAYALAVSVRADLLGFLDIALAGFELAREGAPAGRALSRVARALVQADPEADGGRGLPPALPAEVVLPLALRRFGGPEALPDDLYVKAQLFTAVAFARTDGFGRREVVDRFVDLLDALGPHVSRELSRAA